MTMTAPKLVNIGTPAPLIGLSGYARSGKDTIGEFLVEEHGFKRLAFADALRAVALGADPLVQREFHLDGHRDVHLADLVEDVGWDEAKKNHEVRRFLQKLGTDGCRNTFGEDIWLRPVETQILENKWVQGIVVTDVRFENEARLIKHLGGEVCRVNRRSAPPITDHISEHALDDFMFDHVFNNDGTIGTLRAMVVEYFRLGAT